MEGYSNKKRKGILKKGKGYCHWRADVIKSIQEVDQKIEELFAEKKDELLNDINRLRKGKTALRKYGVKNPVDPRFIDQQG